VIVLGIDPGSVRTGWAVVSTGKRDFQVMGYGTIHLEAPAIADRLVVLHRELAALIDTYKPDAAAVEALFQSANVHNYQSILKLGHARGVALLALVEHGISVAEYPPAEVKKALTGHGRAEKDQVREMIRSLLHLKAVPAQDASDALAIAVCHCFREQSLVTKRGFR